ncbi:hypothetical protein GCM10027052_17050 [Parafrigoribacterium mesophilum]|uniref:hypothetical protein n=1 Tax=Parafrigoribacterium mesophilum TaxID=433646 RepID=UPI0031FDB964
MTEIAAIAACTILAALAVFQATLIAGVPIGRFAWGGQHEVLPPRLRVGSAVSIVLYAAFAFVIAERVGWVTLFGSAGFVQVACWVLFGYFTLGIVMNGLSRSKPERGTMTPVSLVLAALVLVVALG